MLEILQHLFYIKSGEKLIENIIFLFPSIFLNLLKVFFLTKKPFSLFRKGGCFLIDGAKTNSKKDLYYILNKICKSFIEKKKKKSPFFLILVTNLNHIMMDDQIIFKKFFTEKAVSVKFFFLTNDLKFFNDFVLSRSTVVSIYKSLDTLQRFQRFYKFSFQRILIFEGRKKLEITYYQKKIKQNMENLNDIFKENLFKIKNIFSNFPIKLRNEIFVLLIFLNSFQYYKNNEVEDVIKFFLNNKNYIKEYAVYRTLSTTL